MRILAVCGSLQARSANRELLQAASLLIPPDSTLTVFGRLAELPHFNPDLGGEAVAPAVLEWRRELAWADGLLIACPEYGHSLPGALKNAIDWVIGSGELEGKCVATTACVRHASRGKRGLAALAVPLGAVCARVVGGKPIAQGPSMESELSQLLSGLLGAIAEERAAESGYEQRARER